MLPLLLAAGGPRLQAAVWAGVVVAAFCWGQGRQADLRARVEARAPGPAEPAAAVLWRGPLAVRVTGYPSVADDGRWRTPALVVAAGPGHGGAAPRRGDGLWLRGDGPVPRPGRILSLACETSVPPAASVPGAFDLRSFLAGRAMRWTGRVLTQAPPHGPGADLAGRLGDAAAAAREEAAARLPDLVPPREARLAAAVLLGLRTGESRREAEAFAGLGLAHLFAVSGLHVGILAGLLLGPARLAGAGPGLRAAAALGAVPAYVALTGAPGSVVRAGSLVLLALLVPACGRRPRGLRLLGLLFWAVAVWEPQATGDAGLRLSYLAAGAIVLANGLSGGFAVGGPRPLRWLAAAVGVSLAAQWGTLPVVAASFGRFNLWSPVANLAAVPVFGAAVWLLAAAAALSFLWPWGAGALAAWGWLLVRGLAVAAHLAAAPAGPAELGLPVPGPLRVAAWLALTAVAAALVGRPGPRLPRAAALAACLAGGLLVFGPAGRLLPPRGAPVAVQFAVGQGDCALVAFPDGWTALVDLGGAWQGGDGPWAREVLPWLRRQGIGRLDAVVLSHGHRDHTGGAAALGRSLAVGAWVGGGDAGASVDSGPAPWLRPGPARRDLHAWRGWRLEVIDPAAAGFRPPGENDSSLAVVLWRGSRAAMVWTGDLETAGEAALLAAGLVPDGADVWKAGHHGSDTSGSAAFLAVLRPGTVIVSCGVGNRYGHPSHGPYVAAGDTLPLVRTDLQGTVTVRWPGPRPRIRSLRTGSP